MLGLRNNATNMFQTRLENILQQKIISFQKVGGGCISKAQKIVTEVGDEFFLKTDSVPASFSKEANGLLEIAKSKTLIVPNIIAVDNDFLLLQYIEPGLTSPDFFIDFAKQYAEMHRYTSESFGFYEDNYLGSSLQPNRPLGDEANNWPLFFFNKRLNYQFSLVEQNGYATDELRHLFSQLENKFDTILNAPIEPPCLLHGDLWAGNFMINKAGKAVLIDPAVYYGNREADLAMTSIFGGFPQVFYDAYHAAYPLADGWEYRQNIYKLYHILNHLNLFGVSYYDEAIALIKYYVQ